PLQTLATFVDGRALDVTESSETTYQASSPGFATVDPHGLVTAVGPGTAQIIVGYRDKSITVPVSVVTGPAVTVSASPRILWPPNGRVVSIRVSGDVKDTGGGINFSTGRYKVMDEYGSVNFKG